MMNVLALIDHPNLDLIVGPVLLKLIERGVNVLVYVTNAGKTDYFRQHGIQFHTKIDLEKDFIKINSPKVFLNAADQGFAAHRLGRDLDELFKKNGIPTFTLEHGTFFKNAKWNESYLFNADRMAIIGNVEYQKYLDLGVPQEKLVLTGFPLFDEYHEHIRTHRFLPGNYIWIAGQNHTFISESSSYSKTEWRSILSALYRSLISRYPDFELVIKPHPAEPYHDTSQLYAEAVGEEFSNKIRVVDSKFSNIEGISKSAFVVSFSPSVLFESILLKKRAIGFLIDGVASCFEEAKEFGVEILETSLHRLEVDLKNKLGVLLDAIGKNPNTEMEIPEWYLDKYLYKFDGKASERIADAVMDVAASNRQGERLKPIFQKLGFERYMRLMGIAEAVSLDDDRFTVLDIGSHDDLFRNFIPNATYFSYNGMVTEGRSTPFEDKSFDVVVASDVLEHVFCEDRKAFIHELLRIARKKAVFSFPTERAEEFEKFALTLMPHNIWLQEHIERGLPNKTEIDKILDQLGVPYDVKLNHALASWICSLILDHTNIDATIKNRINEFLQKHCYEMENHGPAYRYIYTVLLPFITGQKEIALKKVSKPKNDFVPKVSIIIPVLNKIAYTCKCIEAVWRNSPAGMYEIIIVDNGSEDDTGLFLSTLTRGCVRIVTNAKNLGFAKACNQGAAAAAAPYILFLNNDTEPQEGWLEPLLHVIEHDQTVAAVGSKLLYPNGKIQHAGVLILEDRKLPDPLVAKNIYCNQDADISEANEPRIYQALTGACLLIRKEAFEQVCGFDEGYWNGYEDIDLCFKLQQKQWRLVYEPKSVLVHHESKSGRERFTKSRENIERLHKRWIGTIKPDAIIINDGSIIWPETKTVRKYSKTYDINTYPISKLKIQKQKVSIVILAHNQLRYTKECIESIIKVTPEPHEIIFVDNGSTDNTKNWLQKIVKTNFVFKLIENSENLGFSKGCNQGIEASTGEYILLLNNDVVVTENWVSGMLECFNRNPDTGIVGPMTNNISGLQQLPAIGYTSIEDMVAFARKFNQKYKYRRVACRRIVGFCMLFKRQLVEKIGSLDESFGSGNFEDDDFCLRATLAGYQNMIAGDVFIHHYGSRTFIGNRIDYSASISGNRKVFDAKWSSKEVVQQYGKKLIIQNALNLAEESSRKGDIEQATAHMITAIKEAPHESKGYLKLSEMLIDAKRFSQAQEILESIPQTRVDAKQLALMAYCQEALGNDEKAMEHVERAMTIESSMPLALNVRGVLAYKSGELEAAERFFNRALEADPSFGESYTNLGSMKWATGENEAAFDLFERGFILSPTVGDVVSAYHAAVAETQSFSRAETVLAEACALHPNDRRIAFIKIAVLIQQEKNEDAMDAIEKAMLTFGIDDGILSAGNQIRDKLGPHDSVAKYGNGDALSVCMIVKNEENYLAKCLASAKAIADEMIVVDTGSNDRTKDIAKAFGAKIFDFSWSNDFSEARNYSLSKATGDWILVLDADECLAPADCKKILKIMKNDSRKKFCYAMTTRNYTSQPSLRGWQPNDGEYHGIEAGNGWVPSKKVRLFPNRKGISFVGAVHELVEPTLRQVGILMRECDVPVHHYGKMNPSRVLAKGADYYRLGLKKIEETNGGYQALKELAVQASELEEYHEAVKIWEKAMALNPNDPVACMNAGYAYFKTANYARAAQLSKNALKLNPHLREAALNAAGCDLMLGNIQASISLLEGILAKEHDYPPAMGRIAAAYIIAAKEEEGIEYLRRLRERGYYCSKLIEEQALALSSLGRTHEASLLREALRKLGDSAPQSHDAGSAPELAPDDMIFPSAVRNALSEAGRHQAVPPAIGPC